MGKHMAKERGEEGPEWVVRSKFEDKFAYFMLEKYLHVKGLEEMLNQQRNKMHNQFSEILAMFEKIPTPDPDASTFSITTRSGTTTHDPPYPTPSTVNNSGLTIKEEGPKGNKTATILNKETPQSPTVYQPSRSSSLLFPPG
nr:hypothetical protein [Tanacetum cinerariifolium]